MNVKSSTFALVSITAALAATGCSSLFDGSAASPGRDAVVVRTMRYTELPSGMGRRCAALPRPGDDDTVTIVRYRVNRANYLQAFAANAAQQLRSGDRVWVAPRLCSIQFKAASRPG